MARFCICAILHSDQELDAPVWAVPCFLVIVRNVLACVSWYMQTSRSRVPVGYITYLTCVQMGHVWPQLEQRGLCLLTHLLGVFCVRCGVIVWLSLHV